MGRREAGQHHGYAGAAQVLGVLSLLEAGPDLAQALLAPRGLPEVQVTGGHAGALGHDHAGAFHLLAVSLENSGLGPRQAELEPQDPCRQDDRQRIDPRVGWRNWA